MNEFSVEDLQRILRVSAGEDGSARPESDITDMTFDELGYDSLGLIQTAAAVQREYGVHISDEVISGSATPRMFVDYVNSRLAPA